MQGGICRWSFVKERTQSSRPYDESNEHGIGREAVFKMWKNDLPEDVIAARLWLRHLRMSAVN